MKHLIFDAGGVLVYPRMGEWHIPYRSAEILGEDRAASMRTERFREAHAACMHWLDEDRLVNGIEEERRLRRGFVEELNARMDWRMTESEIARMTDDFTDNPDRYGFFGDVKHYLTKWQAEYRLGILSDAMPSLYPLMRSYDILDLFDAVVISTHIGVTKPDPRMYAAILDALGAVPGDCLFIDDRIINVQAAKCAGLRAVQMSRMEFPSESLWDGPVVHDFEELDRMLNKETWA